MLHVIKLGADPEFFLKEGRSFVSAHDKVPGTKDKPFPLKDGCAIQADGVAVEFNIAPASSGDEFAENIGSALKQVRELVDKKYSFQYIPHHKWNRNAWEAIPEEAKRIGCDPDYQIHGVTWKPHHRSTRMRRPGEFDSYAGGHLHIGFCEGRNPLDSQHKFDCTVVTSSINSWCFTLMDILAKEAGYDLPQSARKIWYGAMGVFRPKSYGVEYRTPSNVWLNFPNIWPFLYDMTSAVLNETVKQQKIPGSYYYNMYSALDFEIHNFNKCFERFGRVPELTRKHLER